MKNRKKITISALSLLLVLVTLLCGCSETVKTASERIVMEAEDADATMLRITGDDQAQSDYVIIYNPVLYNDPTGFDSQWLLEMANTLADGIYDGTNNLISTMTYTPTATTPTELLLGMTGREQATSYKSVVKNYNNLGKGGFLIQAVGKKIFIIGKDLDATWDAVGYFINDVVGYRFKDGARADAKGKTVEIPSNFSYVYEGDKNDFDPEYAPPASSPFKESELNKRDFSRIYESTALVRSTDSYFTESFFDSHLQAYIGYDREDAVCFCDEDVTALIEENILDEGLTEYYYNPIKLCDCVDCKALDTMYGCTGASYFSYIADLAEANPRSEFNILAYRDTLCPPSFAMPDNVNVYVCDKGLCSAHGIDDPDCDVNAEFKEILEAWTEKAENVYVLDFTSDYVYYPATFPNLYTIYENIHYYNEIGIKGVHIRYNRVGLCDMELGQIRDDLCSALLLDPGMDEETYRNLVKFYFKEFYGGKKGDLALEYYNYVDDYAHKDGKCFFTSTHPKDIVSIIREGEDGSVTYDMEMAQYLYDLWQQIHPYIEGMFTNTDAFPRVFMTAYESSDIAHSADQLSYLLFDGIDQNDLYGICEKLFEKYGDFNITPVPTK